MFKELDTTYCLTSLNLLMMLFILFTLSTMIVMLHPITIMIMLLIYSILVCLYLSLWKNNYIYSILLFLIMISGLLIIFLYFSSLISNEKMKFKFNILSLISFLLNSLIFFMYSYKMNLFKKFSFSEINSINKINDLNFNNIMYMYEYPLNHLTIISMLYLLISLFTIIKICSMKSLSLRKIN